MPAIYKRELKSCFHSFVGFLFIAVTLFFVGLYYTVYNLMSGSPYFSYALSSILFLFMISIPVLTMRVLAEERKQKTDQLILTAPVSVGEVVLGKFLALETVFAIPTLIICVYPLILSAYGTIAFAETYISILAFFLYGSTCIAIGIFVSSLTESQVIAAVISFGLLFLGYMMSGICGLISSGGNWITAVLGSYDLYTAFYNLSSGTLNLEAIFYFVSLTGFVLFLTVQSIQKRRYSTSVKNLSMGAYSTGMIVVVLAVVVVLNLAVAQLPEHIKSVDITSNKLYSLTETTKDYLDTLTEDITLYVLVNEDEGDDIIAQTLNRYEDYSKYITVEYVDPAVNPGFYEKYTSGSISTNSIIVVSDKRSTIVDASDVYEYEIDYNTYSYVTTGYDGEGLLTSAIDYVLREDVPKVYLTTGHGEYEIESTFAEALVKQNIEYETITLLDYESIPEDAAVLFIQSANTDFSEEDVEKVIAFMEKGGQVLTVVGYTDEKMTNYNSLLAYMGITVGDGLIVEGDSNHHYYGSQYMLFPNLYSNEYTSGVYGKYYVFAPYAQALLLSEDEETYTYEDILYTSDKAFLRDLGNVYVNLTKQDGDVEGPFSIAVAASKTLEEGTANMVVYGCDMIFTDYVSQQVSGSNCKMFVNTITSMVGTQESNISVPVKEYELSNITMTGTNVIIIGVTTTIILPLSLLAFGFVIWFKRRKR